MPATYPLPGPFCYVRPRSSCALQRVAGEHRYVYIRVKRRELERRLRDLGWLFQRHGGKHDVRSNSEGSFTEYVPRHAEINERLAQAILKRAAERK